MSEAVTLALHGTRVRTLAHKPLQAVLALLSVDIGALPMNITLVMSSSITTTLIMAGGPTVGAAVAYSELVLVRMASARVSGVQPKCKVTFFWGRWQ